MRFTDVFIERPVLASVVSLLIFLIGLRALTMLEVRQYPKTRNTVVTVTTAYPGASSELIQGFITTPLQQAIAEAEGIDYLTGSSVRGRSVVEAHMVLDYDPNAAVAEIQAKVASQRNFLPAQAEDPVIDSTTGESTALMYMAFYGEAMSPSQITDYLMRVVQPRLQAVRGVAKANILGDKTFAMRIWLDPRRMAAFGVTAGDVRRALLANNYLAAAGQTKGSYVAVDLAATTDVSREAEFRQLVIRRSSGALIRLADVARAELGAEEYDSVDWYNGRPAIFIGIEQTPEANPLEVARRVHDLIPDIRSQLPAGLDMRLPYDASQFIDESIHEVFRTLGEALFIVLAVIFLSLGSVRAALIPAVAVPLSMIGSAFLMLVLGYSINLLTLLAMVLAIGLVVDDAIIVVENVHRHIAGGEDRRNAAIHGARELALPILAMTTTLVAVYAPIGFMGGLVGTLFTEFAFTLANAVLVSGLVALTLSPMLSSRVLSSSSGAGRFEGLVERSFSALAERYRSALRRVLDHLPAVGAFALVLLVSTYFLFHSTKSELAPTEDQSLLLFQATAPQTATIDYDEAYTRAVVDRFETFPEYVQSFILLGQGGDTSSIFGGFKMPPTDERSRSQMALQPVLQKELDRVPGLQIVVFSRPSLPGSSGGLPVQFVLTTDADYHRLDEVAGKLIDSARSSGEFVFLKKSIELTRPQTTVVIDRDRAGDLGIQMDQIGQTLATMLGENYVNRFTLQGRSYKVIPQVERRFRRDNRMLESYYIRTGSGILVPVDTLVSFRSSVEPSERTQFQQLNSLTIQAVPAPSVSLGQALDTLESRAREILPHGFHWDYSGESRQYVQQGSALTTTFFLSLLVIFLVLAAQFESWRDPLIILVSVPLSVAGAIAFLAFGVATLNIYTQVGLITLIGLIAKNGILIVEFANQLQLREGLDKREAVERASAIRLRPILMTTLAMVVAMIPLLTAGGPGAVSRFDIGLVIASGLGIGTLFTLFVVPAMYVLLARVHAAKPT